MVKLSTELSKKRTIAANAASGELNTNNYIKRMSAINFIFKNTIFSKYYPNFVDLLEENHEVKIKQLSDSNKFLEKLGFQAKPIPSKSLIEIPASFKQYLIDSTGKRDSLFIRVNLSS